MGILDRLLGRKKTQPKPKTKQSDSATSIHKKDVLSSTRQMSTDEIEHILPWIDVDTNDNMSGSWSPYLPNTSQQSTAIAPPTENIDPIPPVMLQDDIPEVDPDAHTEPKSANNANASVVFRFDGWVFLSCSLTSGHYNG